MRVTRAIKDYIEEQVSAIFPKPSELPEVIAYQEVLTKREIMWEQIQNKVQELLEAQVVQLNEVLPEGFRILETNIGRTQERDWNSLLSTNARFAKDNLQKKKNKAVADIVVSLELGGTKDTLDKMLAELAAQVKDAYHA